MATEDPQADADGVYRAATDTAEDADDIADNTDRTQVNGDGAVNANGEERAAVDGRGRPLVQQRRRRQRCHQVAGWYGRCCATDRRHRTGILSIRCEVGEMLTTAAPENNKSETRNLHTKVPCVMKRFSLTAV